MGRILKRLRIRVETLRSGYVRVGDGCDRVSVRVRYLLVRGSCC